MKSLPTALCWRSPMTEKVKPKSRIMEAVPNLLPDRFTWLPA